MKLNINSLEGFFIITGIFGALFGIFLFMNLTDEVKQYERNLDLVKRGDADPIEALITRKKTRKVDDDIGKNYVRKKTQYLVSIESEDSVVKFGRIVSKELWDTFNEGDSLVIYSVENNKYYVPKIDHGGAKKGRWFFLLFCSAPLLLGLTIYLFKLCIR